MMKGIGIFTIVSLLLSCNKFSNKEINVNSQTSDDKTITIEETQNYGIVDSMTTRFLSKANYNEARNYCGKPLHEIDFILNEYGLIGLRKGLKNVFSDEELSQPIVVRETKWQSKDDQFISVWYQKKETKWIPVDYYKYSKSTQF